MAIALALALHVAAVALVLVLGSERHAPPAVQTISLVDLDVAPPPPAPTPPPNTPPPPPKPEEAAPTPAPDLAPTHLPAPKPIPAAPASPASARPEAAPQPAPSEPDYLPQYQITAVPVLPVAEILARIQYPPLAARLGIEATVYLELYIDDHGVIRKIVVLKDPGNGFAEAAIQALQGLTVTPAEANGKPVAVRFRYPIRFTLK